MRAITTRLGRIRGLESEGVKSFLGLRYGAPPTGSQRFLAPVKACGWQDVFDAVHYPNRSMQNSGALSLRSYVPGEPNEDCLFLNITTPALTGSLRPLQMSSFYEDG